MGNCCSKATEASEDIRAPRPHQAEAGNAQPPNPGHQRRATTTMSSLDIGSPALRLSEGEASGKADTTLLPPRRVENQQAPRWPEPSGQGHHHHQQKKKKERRAGGRTSASSVSAPAAQAAAQTHEGNISGISSLCLGSPADSIPEYRQQQLEAMQRMLAAGRLG
ncbi:hypothetical protein DV735_g696, partial [Chaetothyriales sp. CBS 134920]